MRRLIPQLRICRKLSGKCSRDEAIVAGLDDVALVGEPVEERIGHLGVAEDGRPLAWRYSGGARLLLAETPWANPEPRVAAENGKDQ